MKQERTTGMEPGSGVGSDDRPLDQHFSDLIETVWACERQWTVDDRVDAAIKYGRQ
ncbi:MAG TPA: hypothetical protein VHK65_13465 [Candidatus Dormibacteraeota bacterium]|nr:hypothetical protein [Candidatus Dormibacteraeota bacterium]